MNILEILDGLLLGDGTIKLDNYNLGKYFSFKVTGKDRRFLLWINDLLSKFNLKCWICNDNTKSGTSALHFYINNCPYPNLMNLREQWYIKIRGKNAQKIIPRDLELTSTVMLHWYLGDGCMVRRKNDSNRVPFIVLATNTFSREDIGFLIQKLKELNLNFYPVKYKSGFTKKESGYCLYSNTQDGTPYRFFKLIGLECPKEISGCSTGRKGIYHEEKFFRDKWPTEEDWIKILSNVKGTGKMLKERRIQMNISRKELTKLLDVNKDYIRNIENGKRNSSVGIFRKVLKALNLDISYLLRELSD